MLDEFMNTFQTINKVFGKNINMGNYYSVYCRSKIEELLSKYAARVISYSASLEKKNHFYKIKLKIIMNKNLGYESTGRSRFPYKALSYALLNMSKRIRRHIRRKKFIRKSKQKAINIKQSFMFYNN